MVIMANVCPQLQIVKILLRPLSENRRFRKRFDTQHVKVSQYLRNLHERTFIMFFKQF